VSIDGRRNVLPSEGKKVTPHKRWQEQTTLCYGLQMENGAMNLQPFEGNTDLPVVARGERVYAIGDIHGRHDLLVELLNTIWRDIKNISDGRRPKLLFLGDFIDRGDDSCDVMDALWRLCEEHSDVVCLLGNHEAALLDFLRDPVKSKAWLRYGAAQTLASYGIATDLRAPDRPDLLGIRDALKHAMGPHVAFLSGLPHYFRSGNVLFTHAGVNPNAANDIPERQAALWGHPKFQTEQPLANTRVVHGHYDNPEPIVLAGRICIDTGAYYSGILTAVRLDDATHILTSQSSSL
jgi:serine/threonine protein phosphatase 1